MAKADHNLGKMHEHYLVPASFSELLLPSTAQNTAFRLERNACSHRMTLPSVWKPHTESNKAQELQVCHDPATKVRPNSAIRLLLFAQRCPLTSLKGVRMKCCSGHLNLQSAILRLAWFRQTPPRTANLSFHAVAVVSHKYLPGTAKPQES